MSEKQPTPDDSLVLETLRSQKPESGPKDGWTLLVLAMLGAGYLSINGALALLTAP